MRLFEYEGKRLLAAHGLPVPTGALWPDLPHVNGPVVVKAQVLAGRRGRRGGIRFVDDVSSAGPAVEEMLGSQIDSEVVNHVYVEEKLEALAELFVAALPDRERRSHLVLTTARGGMDVEDIPSADLFECHVDPFMGLLRYRVRELTHDMGLRGQIAERAGKAVEAIYRAYRTSDAELVEVNPLIVTRDGMVVAADAKVVLNDSARFRHPEWSVEPRGGTAFERQCSALGAIGVEMEGSIAAIVSGAGLMMATVDLVTAEGGTLRAAVDLGGLVLSEAAQLPALVRAVLDLHPRVILVNAFFQLAYCDTLAHALASIFPVSANSPQFIVRLRGRRLEEAKAILKPLGVQVVEDLAEACRLTVQAAGRNGDRR